MHLLEQTALHLLAYSAPAKSGRFRQLQTHRANTYHQKPTPILKNTKEDSLSEFRHPVADAILEYRKWKKLKEDVESCVHAIRSDCRIHGHFNPLGTDTDRVSSS